MGAQIISVPMAQPIHNANRAFITLMVSLTAIFAALFIVLNVMMSTMLVRPIRRIASAAD